jgi:hypothetical protein
VAGSYEHGNEPSGFIKGRELPNKLCKCQLLEDFATGDSWLRYLVGLLGRGIHSSKTYKYFNITN